MSGGVVAGFGFRGAATADSLHAALAAAGGGQGVTALAAPADKAGAACLVTLARALRLPVIAVPPAAMRAARTLTSSPRITRIRGTGSVAEAAALCGAGPGAGLLGPRAVSADRLATAALAAAPDRLTTAPPAAVAGP